MEQEPQGTWPEMKERGCYILWFLFSLLACSLAGLTLDLTVSRFAGGVVNGLVWVPLIYASMFTVTMAIVWRRHGEAHGRFHELESDYQRALDTLGVEISPL